MKKSVAILLLSFSTPSIVFSQPAPPPPPFQNTPLDVFAGLSLVFAIVYAIRKLRDKDNTLATK